jgi:TonB family protein
MKNIFATIFLCMVIGFASARTMYEIGGKYRRPVTKDVLNTATLISDFVDGYPVNWINDYISVIITSTNGKGDNHASGQNLNLTADQNSLLKASDIGTTISIQIRFRYPNAVTGKTEVRDGNISLTVVPFIQAAFPGGENKMKAFFAERGMDDISKEVFNSEHNVKVSFMVNADGKISNVRLTESSGDADMDISILKALKEMPLWRPASNSDGTKVKQEFEFRIYGMNGC